MEQKSLLYKLRMIFPKKERRYFILLFFLILISTLFDFLGVSLILPLVNLLMNPAKLEQQSWYHIYTALIPVSNRNTGLLILVLIIIGVYILKNLFAIYMSVVQGVFVTRNQLATSARMLDCYMRKPYTFHLQHNTAEILRGINTDVNSAYGLVSNLITVFSSLLISIMLVVYLIAVDFWLTVSIVAGLVIYSVIYFLLVRKKLKAAGQTARKLQMSMFKSIHQAMGGIKEIKLMGREQFFVDSYRACSEEYVRSYRTYTILSNVPKHLVEILCIGGVLGLVAFKIAARQDLTSIVGSLSAFAVASIRLMPSVNKINSNINAISYRMPGLNAVCEVIDENWGRDFDLPPAGEGEHRMDCGRGQADIQVENLSFAYPDSEKNVLTDVNLTVKGGSSVGIIGVTGAGKSTLVDLILGLLEPRQGRILYGGQDIRENYGQWQNRIGYIPQSIYLADESIRANVAFGIRPDRIDEQRVWRALEQAQLADFVREQKDGLDTVIGERGVRISGGQRQRIGIARALYNDPDILFLDEATSALDTQTERAVMESVHRLSGEKTCIIIAHRLSTIEGCDAVYRITDGNAVQEKG